MLSFSWCIILTLISILGDIFARQPVEMYSFNCCKGGYLSPSIHSNTSQLNKEGKPGSEGY